MKTQKLNKLISLFFLAILIIGLSIWFYLLRIGYFEEKLNFLNEEKETSSLETMGFQHLKSSSKDNSVFEVGSNYEFSGWYNDKDSLVSSDSSYPYGRNLQVKDSVLNLRAKFKNVK